MSYNLINEPWIDTIMEDGSQKSVGLRELFENAHRITDMAPAEFHGVTFPFYNYAALRLFCGILADAYSYAEEEFDAEELLSAGSFDMSDGSVLSEYLKTFENRFDLFDENHPFLQATKDEIDYWRSLGTQASDKATKILIVNPCAPAETARINEVREDDLNEIIRRSGLDNPSPLFGTDLKAVDGDKFESIITDIYAVPAKEWAYICLYQNSIAPGSGSGNKSCLAGNGFYAEVLQGENIFQTIVMNSVSIAMSEDHKRNIPAWRWDSMSDLFFKPDTVVLDTLSGLFCPARLFAANKVEDNVVRSVSVAKYNFPENMGNFYYENLRQKWAIYYEPHMVAGYKKYPTKMNKKKKTLERDYNANPYQTFSDAANRLWILVGATQTRTGKLSDKDLKTLAMAARNTQKNFSKKNNGLLFTESVHIRNYYRSCDSHWVYKTTGVQDGYLPYVLLMDKNKQDFIRKTCTFIANINEQLYKQTKAYLKRAGINTGVQFSTEMVYFLGVNGEEGKFFNRVAEARNKKDLDALWAELTEFIRKTALSIFSTIQMPSKIAEFYKMEKIIKKDIYGKKGAKLYV